MQIDVPTLHVPTVLFIEVSSFQGGGQLDRQVQALVD